jgi:hypothetical protein
MRIWTSTESMIDIDEPLRSARRDVERVLSASVASVDYGAGVFDKWSLIYIIMEEDDPNYPEIQRYKKHCGVVEFRLKVDHQAFKEGDPETQRKLLVAAFLRSIELARELNITNFDLERFRSDVVGALKGHHWV